MKKKLKWLSAICFLFLPVLFVAAQTTLSLQAEDAAYSAAVVESEHTGYTGSGYINFDNAPGGYIEWTVSLSGASQATCSFVYANGGDAARVISVSLNGSVVSSNLSCPVTGDWTAWSSVSVSGNLAAGSNTIRVTGVSDDGGPNIDRLDLQSSGGASGSSGDVNGDGSITIVDALMVAQYYVGLNPQGFNAGSADISGDGQINIVDALMIAQVYVGIIPPPTQPTLPPTNQPTTPPTQPPTNSPTNPPAGGETLYVSPSGSASASGTSSSPTTLESAITRIGPGGTIYMRSGTYNYSTTVLIERGNDGTSSARKNIFAYSGETPVLNFSAMAEDSSNRGLQINGHYWHVRGLIVQEAGDNGIFIGGNYNIIENCITRRNHDTGLQLSRYSSDISSSEWPSYNQILSCESYDNSDSDGEDADGFAAKLTCGEGNLFRGCISHNNIDDGWDLYTKSETGPIGAVTLEYCISYNNGTLTDGTVNDSGDRNGFKLGGEDIAVNHILRRCFAFNNGKHGFTYNRNLGSIEVTNCAAFNNTERNFNFDGGTSSFRNCLSYRAGDTDRIIGNDIADSNAWSDEDATINGKGLDVTDADFLSVTPGSVSFGPDGLPDTGSFFKLAAGSDLIDAGVTTSGIEYNGSAPDLGMFEY